MKPQWDEQIADLNLGMGQWHTAYPRLPQSFVTSHGVTISTGDLNAAIAEIHAEVIKTNESQSIDALALNTYNPTILSSLAVLSAALKSAESNPSPEHLHHIATYTWSLKSILVWLQTGHDASPEMQSRVMSLDIDGKIEALKRLNDDYTRRIGEAISLSETVEESFQKITTALDQIKGLEREASTAKTNAEASAATAASNKDAVASTLTKLTDGEQSYLTLLTNVEALSLKATTTLESTSKVALAASFSTRRKTLEWERIFWNSAFAIGVAMLFVVGFVVIFGSAFLALPILGVHGALPSIFKPDNSIDTGALLARAVLLSPIVWGTWFAVTQSGRTTRLIEDYAFKEAAALAFVGYQREMSNDPDMVKLLRESAINAFGNQPTRIFEKSEPASPMHELLDKALEKGGAEKVLDFFKSILGRR